MGIRDARSAAPLLAGYCKHPLTTCGVTTGTCELFVGHVSTTAPHFRTPADTGWRGGGRFRRAADRAGDACGGLGLPPQPGVASTRSSQPSA